MPIDDGEEHAEAVDVDVKVDEEHADEMGVDVCTEVREAVALDEKSDDGDELGVFEEDVDTDAAGEVD